MAITSDEAGILITGDSVMLAAHLSNWYAGKIQIVTGLKTRPERWRWMAAQCESDKRTHTGIFIDYTVWLAGYGIEPIGTDAARAKLNKTGRRALDAGLRRARLLATARRNAHESNKEAEITAIMDLLK